MPTPANIESLDQSFMAEAIRLAEQNVKNRKGGPFGAVVVKDNQIIARGCNQVTATNDPTAHAEVQAIRQACQVLGDFQLKGCTIYTSCEPCPMCLGAIYWARPEKVYFASTKQDAAVANFDDSFIYDEIQQPYSCRKIPMIHLTSLQRHSQEVFNLWKNTQNKIEY